MLLCPAEFGQDWLDITRPRPRHRIRYAFLVPALSVALQQPCVLPCCIAAEHLSIPVAVAAVACSWPLINSTAFVPAAAQPIFISWPCHHHINDQPTNSSINPPSNPWPQPADSAPPASQEEMFFPQPWRSSLYPNRHGGTFVFPL